LVLALSVPPSAYLGLSHAHERLQAGRLEVQALRAAVTSEEARADEARSIVSRLHRPASLLARSLDEFEALADVGVASETLAAGGGGSFLEGEDPEPESEPEPEAIRAPVRKPVEIASRRADFWLDLLRERAQDGSSLLTSRPSVLPVRGLITHGYSWRNDPITGLRAFHRGLDISARRGTPITSSADGVVTFAGWNGTYGRCVEVSHGYGLTSRYGHMRKILVQSGDSVRKGQTIGEVGSSGRATGPHLHYEVLENGKVVDPVRYLADEPDFVARRR